ncbi:MAG: type II secretion system protein GspG [bacterium JZ-2024 1]
MGNAQKNKGFTTVETIAVVSLMFIFFSISTSAVVSTMQMQKRVQTEEFCRDLAASVERYFHDVGHFPLRPDDQGLALLARNADNQVGWRGPYIDIQRRFADEWQRNLIYRFSITAGGIPVALVLSRGRNGVMDSNLATFHLPGWTPGGDDIAFKISAERMIKEQEERTRRILKDAAGLLKAQNPNLAPAIFKPGMQDAWNRPIQYVRCSPLFAVVFSTGFNGNDDSGATLCNEARTLGDDLAEFVQYSTTGRIPGLLNPGWTGGLHASNVLCDSYTYILINNFNEPLRVEYYDRQKNFNTVNVSARSMTVIPNVYPWFLTAGGQQRIPLVVYRGSLISDQFNPVNADLDQDCYHVKTFNM